MADATTQRLDTADLAMEFGWQVESTSCADQFSRDEVTIAIEYTPDDNLQTIARWGTSRERELFSDESVGQAERLRFWITGIGPPKPVDSKGLTAPKLRWSREKWLHKPTQEVVDDADPRVPRTVDAAKKLNKLWYLIGSQADVPGGYYRRDVNMDTAAAADPMFTATWHPRVGPTELLTQGSAAQAYTACVRHYQASNRA